MQTRRFDLVVLGSGSTAFAAAIRAAELGKTAAMTENRTLGGTCVNRGCLPSKNLIAAANIIHDAAHPRYPGIEAARLRFNFSDLVRQKDEVISYYRGKKYQSIVGDRISVFEGSVQFVERDAVQVGDVRLEADRFLVLTGSRPFIPSREGLGQSSIPDERSPHQSRRRGARIRFDARGYGVRSSKRYRSSLTLVFGT